MLIDYKLIYCRGIWKSGIRPFTDEATLLQRFLSHHSATRPYLPPRKRLHQQSRWRHTVRKKNLLWFDDTPRLCNFSAFGAYEYKTSDQWDVGFNQCFHEKSPPTFVEAYSLVYSTPLNQRRNAVLSNKLRICFVQPVLGPCADWTTRLRFLAGQDRLNLFFHQVPNRLWSKTSLVSTY
jgi:hypothetical protein